MKIPILPNELKIGDLLAGFDRQTLYLLERGYLDGFRVDQSSFAADSTPNAFDDSFQGFRMRRLHSYAEQDRDLAVQNIENWLGLFRQGSHSFLMSIDARESRVPELCFMAGRRSQASGLTGKPFADFLNHGMAANFPGSDRVPFGQDHYFNWQHWANQTPYAGVVTGIPSRKKPEERFFVQGIERFLDSVVGLEFSVLLVAEPYSSADLTSFLNPVLDLKTAIGQMRKFTLTDTKSIADSLAHTLSVNVFGSGGSTHQDSTSTSHTDTKLGGAGAAGAIGGVIGSIAGAFTGPLAPLAVPLLGMVGSAIGTAGASLLGGNLSSSDTITKTVSDAVSQMAGMSLGYARTTTRTLSTSQSVGREAVNYAVEYALELLDLQLARLRTGRNYGFWNTGLYIMAEDEAAFQAVRHAAVACFSGEESHLEPLRFVILKSPSVTGNGDIALIQATSGHNSRLAMFDELNLALDIPQHPLGGHMQGIGTPLTTSELGILCAPPQRECRAISVTERAIFGGKTLEPESNQGDARLDLGRILYFGERTSEMASISLNGLARHVLVTGITGSGKTNTVHGICARLDENKVPWMVIEPAAKCEYRNVGGSNPPHVFRLGSILEDGPVVPFRFNPFYFPRGVEVLSHIDRVKAAFNAAFPMYASMPYLLEEAIVRCYEEAGWNLDSSTNHKAEDPENPWDHPAHRLLFPTLGELLPKIDDVVASKRYDLRLEMDLSAALRARLGSLLLGSKGSMLNTRETLDMRSMIGKRVVLEMASMGNDEEKVLMMGLLIGSLFEVAQANGLANEGKLRHVMVIEEAHRLLRAAPIGDNPEIANVRGGAVEQFANLLSEMRAFGHGVIVVDQSPCRLLPDVVRSTHLKIVHQLAAEEDRIAVGACMALNDSQTRDLARLRRDKGEAVVFQPEWPQAYCISVDKLPGLLPVALPPCDNIRRKRTADVFPGSAPSIKRGGPSATPTAVYRALCGMLLGNRKMLESALPRNATKPNPLDVAMGLSSTPTACDFGFLASEFEELLAVLMRVAPVGLDVLGDLPERMKAAANDPTKILEVGRKLQQINGGADALPMLLRCLVPLYARSRGFAEEPARIARENPPGDACCLALRDFARRNAHDLLGSVELEKDHRLLIERLLIEQAVRLAGLGRAAEIVERCHSLP